MKILIILTGTKLSPLFYFCLFIFALYLDFAWLLNAQNNQEDNTKLDKSIPGLGINGFSQDDIQQQFEAVRQLSATPLQLNTKSNNETAAKPIEQQSQQQTKAAISKPQEPPTLAKTNQANRNNNNNTAEADRTLKFAPRRLTPTIPTQKTTPKRTPPAKKSQRTEKKNISSAKNAKTQKSQTLAKAQSLNTLNNTVQRGTPNKQTNVSKTIPFGESFHVSLHGLIWTYIPGLSEYPRKPEFERELGNLKTSFRFEFPAVGRYFLTFSRQFPSTGKLEYYNAEIIVEKPALQYQIQGQDSRSNYQNMVAAPIIKNNTLSPNVSSSQLGNNASPSSLTKNNLSKISNIDKDINYRITSQVISDIRQMLEDGEFDAAYQTLSSWPERERGEIYDTAAQYFFDAGMNEQAVNMWQRNANIEGYLQSKALVGITKALSNSFDSKKLLEWLPQFLEQAKNEQNQPLQERQIGSEDFANIFTTLFKKSPNTAQTAVIFTDSKNAAHLLDFYETYVNSYSDQNEPEILYSMGLFYEQPGEHQNLRKAKDSYNNIQINHSVDEYSQKASERLNYLNRQFFLVR